MASKSVYVDVDVDLDDFDDEELIEELHSRKVEVYTTIAELQKKDNDRFSIIDYGDEVAFTDTVKQLIWELDTAKVGIIQKIINESHHKSYLEAA